MYKCPYCSHKELTKSNVISHIHNSHESHVRKLASDDGISYSSLISTLDFDSTSSSSIDSGFSGGGGDFGGGGASGDW